MYYQSTREMVAELGKDGEVFWNKMKQLEVEFYRMKVLLADGSAELKEEVSALFDTLRKVDLKMIGAVDNEEHVNTQEVPRLL